MASNDHLVLPSNKNKFTDMSDEAFMELGPNAKNTYVARAIVYKNAQTSLEIDIAINELKIEDLLTIKRDLNNE